MVEGKITSIVLKEYIDESLDMIGVNVDDFDQYILFGKYTDYVDYVDRDVSFNVRRDIVHGISVEVICDIAIRSIITTVSSDTDLDVEDFGEGSIIPVDGNYMKVITFNRDTIKPDDVALSQIILIVGYKNGKSRVSNWKDFTCLDVNSKSFNLRLFTNDDSVDEFCENAVGKYVMVNIKYDRSYGLQVYSNSRHSGDSDISIYDHEVQVPAEVLAALLRLKYIVRKDDDLNEYVEKYDMINVLKDTIYFEPGYHLVEMYSEIILINSVCRIFAGYNRDLLYRAVFASRGYLIGSNLNLSNPIVNYHRIITSKLKNDSKLIKLLDITGGVEDGDLDKQVYLSIRKQVTSIMKGRRGINEANKLNVTLTSLNDECSGMFQRGLLGNN